MSEELREKSIDMLLDMTGDMVLAREIEESVHKDHGNNYNEYCGYIVKCLENLKDQRVLDALQSKVWDPNEFHKISREVLNPEKWQKIHEERNPKSIKERKKGISKCPRCKSWYTTYTLVQTRSGDEGMTQKFSCEECEFAWKM